MSFCIVWNVAICFSKLSVLQLYTAIFPMRQMIIPARAMGCFVILWNSGNVIAQLNMCRPFARNFDQTIEGDCGSQRDFYLAIGVFNIILEVIMLAMPTPFLYKLKLPMRKKIVLIVMFTIGIMCVLTPSMSRMWQSLTRSFTRTCAISIYRQVTLPHMEFSDMTHSGLLSILFSDLEPPVSISLACIPHLRPLLGNSWAASNTTGYNASAEKGFSSKPGGRNGGSRLFETLKDDSEVELQPAKGRVTVESTQYPGSERGKPAQDAIRVERRWEVTSDTS